MAELLSRWSAPLLALLVVGCVELRVNPQATPNVRVAQPTKYRFEAPATASAELQACIERIGQRYAKARKDLADMTHTTEEDAPTAYCTRLQEGLRDGRLTQADLAAEDGPKVRAVISGS